jgi:NADH dehydrogenase
MILITGGTGFIGKVLIRHLTDLGLPVKLLVPPSKDSPDLPKGVPLEVAVSSFSDEKGLRSALKNVDYIFHLASVEALGRQADLTKVDVRGTETIIRAAAHSNIKRFFYVSHLGTDRASAYPLLKAKAIAESHIKNSGIPYTIFRSAIVFGENDHFTTNLAKILRNSPFFVMLPEKGRSLLQPIWVEDLVTVMSWSLDIPQTLNSTIEIGGPEYLSFKEICDMITEKLNIKRHYIDVPPVFLSIVTELLEMIKPGFPTSVFWLDYLAEDRITNLDVLPTTFDLLPARMSQRLGYLESRKRRRK